MRTVLTFIRIYFIKPIFLLFLKVFLIKNRGLSKQEAYETRLSFLADLHYERSFRGKIKMTFEIVYPSKTEVPDIRPPD